MAKVLIIDDDRDVVDLLRDVLNGTYETVFASDSDGALHQLAAEQPDLIILDLRMPLMDGAVLLPKIRALSTAGIIVLSGRDQQADRVPALAFADDFVSKPFDLYDLLARIETVLRRAARSVVSPPPEQIQVGDLIVFKRNVTVGGEDIHATPTELRLLTMLVSSPGKPLSRADLAQEVFGYVDEGTSHRIDTLLHPLRAKLRRTSAPDIVTVRRHGIMLTARDA